MIFAFASGNRGVSGCLDVDQAGGGLVVCVPSERRRKMNTVKNLVIIILAFVIFVAFFLPWASVGSPAASKLQKLLGMKEQAPVTRISGYEIPVIANSKNSILAITVIKIFNPDISDADKKSYLIWIVPILAVLLAVFSLVLGKNKWVNLAIGIIGSLIFAIAMYKIKSTDMDKLLVRVVIEQGLMITLWSYLGIGIAGLAAFGSSLIKKKS
jgi:hypothetical protein